MELACRIGTQIMSMMIYVLVGAFAYRKGMVSDEAGRGFSNYLLYLAVPCMLFNSFLSDYSTERMQGLGYAALISVFLLALEMVIARILCGGQEQKDRIDRASVIFTNSGNLTIPLIGAAMGMEAIFFVCGNLLIVTVLMWVYCWPLIGGKDAPVSLKKIILNPNIWAMVLGLVFFRYGLRPPVILHNAITGLSGTVGPISMMIIGIQLGKSHISEMVKNTRAWKVCFYRLLVTPVLLLIFARLTGIAYLLPNSREIFTIVMVGFYAPVASNVVIFSQLFRKEEIYASQVNVMSSVLCMASVPLMVALESILLP